MRFLRKVNTCTKLTPVQQAHIAKYALANGNKAAILRYTKEFQTEFCQHVESKN